MQRVTRRLLRSLIAVGLVVFNLFASEQHGEVTFGGLPVPGATVTATQGNKKFTAVTNPQGAYSFPDLSDGLWTMQVDMLGFSTVKNDITVGPETKPATWELKMLPLDQIHAETQPATPPSPPAAASEQPKKPESKPSVTETAPARDELDQRAADGLLINGSQNNGASSPFALFPAFGNNRNGSRSLYNAGLGIFDNNSIWDARTFSFTGQNTPKPGYNLFSANAYFGGPLKIPHLVRNGPNIFVGYQWTRNRTDTTTSALMPTAAQRAGDVSPSILIPKSQINPQALALLALYPLPNFAGSGGYNYQVPLVGVTHQDSLQSRWNKSVDRKDQLFGTFAFQDTRQATPNVFGFLDTTDSLGLTTSVNWFHRFAQGLFGTFQYQFSRFSMDLTPYFENRENISGLAGIAGNDQNPLDWGPPSLNFTSIQGLSDAEQKSNHNETNAVSASFFWNRSRHNFQFGGDFKKQQFNVLGQNDGRGTLTFTGTTPGSDFADFLLGAPSAASIAFGNADKYLRDSLYDAFFNDDWRISSAFTLNAGVRWEYGSPITELYGRLVNLDVVPGFSNEAAVLATNPIGPLTGQRFPDSLIRPDKRAFEPRVAIAWRPLPASSLVVRAGYGVYYDTSVYQSLATAMSQQFPLPNTKNISVQNTAATPLTLANAFDSPSTTTFGIDPNFRPGYSQNWQVSVQRDLPGSLQMTATYLGIKGTHGTQEFLPNTYPAGAINPCPACPTDYEYVTSNGNSTREAGSIQLRRRLHSGFTATVQYTFAKAIDDDAVLGGAGASGSTPVASATPGAAAASSPRNLLVAQNWLDLSAERGLSYFDQRHLLTSTIQYTTGMGVAGGTLLNGWRGTLFKGWLLSTTISAGTGMPLTPAYLAPEQGTGVTNALRPEYTGASLYNAPPGLSLNPAAYAAPLPGQFGDAGRDSITGPFQFFLNASAGRTFRLSDRLSGDLRIDSTNPLNHVTFPSWNTTFGSPQFGLPLTASPMRSLTTGFILRF